MMHPDDGRPRWSWQPLPEEEHAVSQSLVGGSDRNLFTVPPQELLLYAFLDSVEHEVAGVTGDVFSQRGTFGDAPFGTDLLVARFDCVALPYFNDQAANRFAPFYGAVRGEDIDRPHDLDKPYWHDPGQTAYHQNLVQQLLASRGEFVVLYLVVHATELHEAFFDRLFEAEGWLGLGVVPRLEGRGAAVMAYPPDDDELARPIGPWTVKTVYDLTARRLHNLRHVFSVDFAPDAVMPFGGLPGPPRVPVPVPQASKGRRLGKPHGTKKARDKFPVGRVRTAHVDVVVTIVRGRTGAPELLLTLHEPGPRRVGLKKTMTKKILFSGKLRGGTLK